MNKDQIINNYNKNEFMNYLESDLTGEILKIFDQDGINILSMSNKKEEIITYILNFSKYKNELLQNIQFLDVFLNSDLSKYYASLKNLDYKTYELILERAIKLKKSNNDISRLFSFFDDDFKLITIENKILNQEIIKSSWII